MTLPAASVALRRGTAFRLTFWWRRWLLVLVLGLAAGRPATTEAAPLPLPDGGLLTHPRPEGDAPLPVLAESRDVFVNGHLGRATRIRCQGRELRMTADRRFADRVPWPAGRRLEFTLEGPGGPWNWSLELAAPVAAPPPAGPPPPAVPARADSLAPKGETPDSPGWLAPIRVRLDGSPLSTTPGGSYWIFPQAGTEWVADRREAGWLRLPLRPNLAAWVPEERVRRLGLAPAQPEPRLLGPAVTGGRLPDGDLELRLALSGGGPPLWREESGPAGEDWRLILSGTRGRLDWVELDPAGALRQLDWEVLPGDELLLRASLVPGAFQGHSLFWEPGVLRLVFHRRTAGLKGARIVLDPGHGGRESGCIGASGTQEKDLTLLLARELRRELEKAGAHVELTRDSDSTLSLGARVARTRELRADFLLSLHYNSVGEGESPWKADGYMVFSWSPWSADAAALLHGELRRRLPLRDKGLHWRSLGVCRHQGCPALLLEVGSLAHPDEESRLLDPAFRHRQVKAIRRGLEAWFRAGGTPPAPRSVWSGAR
ncbi:MAG: N-acetylmuramoyl-L-alanine amidase [Candidatus Delongbacteria bacterium]